MSDSKQGSALNSMNSVNKNQKPDTTSRSVETFQVFVVDQLAGLDEHADAWNTLALQAPPQLPGSSYAWLSAFFEHSVQPGETWRCIFAYEKDQLAGVLPLIIKRKNAAFLNSHILSIPKDDHTIAVSPLLAPGKEAAVLNALIKTAWSIQPDALWIEMNDIAANSCLLHHLNHYIHLNLSHREGAYLPVTGDQDTYQSSLSKNFRSNQRKAENKLNKMADVEYEFLSGAEASVDHLTEFLPVEASGWKGREGTAIQQSADLIAFYKTLTDRLANAGWLEWHFLRAEGKTIAANLAVRFNHAIIVWKLGYEEAYSRSSPGGLLFQKLLDRNFPNQQIDEINLLTEAPWYDNWKMAKREYYGLRIYNSHTLRSILLGFIPNSIYNLARRNKLIRAVLHPVRKLKHAGKE